MHYVSQHCLCEPSRNVLIIVVFFCFYVAGKWNHIENLDDFFTRVYEYHQKSGFACMMLSEMFRLL